MGFDEWMNENHAGLFDIPHQRECYEAGAQSRQAEVDDLQKRIDRALDLLKGKSIGEVYKAIRILKGDNK